MRRVSIAAVLILVALGALPVTPATAGGGPYCGGLTDETTTTVGLSKNCFVPTITRIDPGERVRFVNKDLAEHTVTGTQLTWGDTTYLHQGDSVAYTFDDEGTFPYTCILHPGMVGAIVVGDGRGDGLGTVTGGVISQGTDAKEGSLSEGEVGGGTSASETPAAPPWSIVMAAIGALVLLAFGSLPIRKRVAEVALTTKP